jgi:hypothetical protein
MVKDLFVSTKGSMGAISNIRTDSPSPKHPESAWTPSLKTPRSKQKWLSIPTRFQGQVVIPI